VLQHRQSLDQEEEKRNKSIQQKEIEKKQKQTIA
jgi:hypothetical protein